MPIEKPPKAARAMYRAAYAAAQAGITKEIFLSGCANGDIPVTVEKIGPRKIAYVRAAQFTAWLNKPHTSNSLFT